MRTRGRLLDVLDKAEHGPIVEEGLFDRQWIQAQIARLIKQYDVRWEKATYVTDDDQLADRVYDAGRALALETGVYCLDTKRRLLFEDAELDEAMAMAPCEVTLGEGADAVTLRARRPEENARVAVCGGPFSLVSEELFVPLLTSYAQEPLIDVLDSASLASTYGRSVKAGSPWEAVGCWEEADLALQVIRRVGRPGMSISCAESATTAIGELTSTSYGGFRAIDFHHACFISELKTNYHELTKAIHFARTGSHVNAFYAPIYGGYVGGAEGLAIAIVAGMILLQACYGATTVNPAPGHAHLSCNTHPDMLAAESVALQALSRNTNLVTAGFVRAVGGPGTKSIFYETAARVLADVPAGVALVKGVQQSMCILGHSSGLDARFCAQVTHAAEGLTRREADLLVTQLVPRYSAGLAEKPTGKRFDQVYDPATIKPLPAWQQMYEEACTEIVALGLPL